MQTIDYQAVLMDMEEKRESLTAAIENMRRWLGGPTANPSSGRPSSGELFPTDAFFGMSIPDAAEKYLSIVKAKKPINEIADALERGGITHSSKNFRNTVSTALYREDAKPEAKIIKVAEGEWGLSEWYPGVKTKRAKQSGRNVEGEPEPLDVETVLSHAAGLKLEPGKPEDQGK